MDKQIPYKLHYIGISMVKFYKNLSFNFPDI
jgi:hypothetical protein